MIRLLPLVAVLLLTQGCLVTTAKHQLLMDRVAALEQSGTQLANLTERLDKRTENLKTWVDEQDGQIRELVANLRADLEDLRMQLARTGGTQEDLLHRVDAIQKKVTGLKGLMDERLGGDAESLPESLPEDAEGLFALGVEKFSGGFTKTARAIFTEFLRRFPDHEKADDAQYSIGETLFTESRFLDAVPAYRKVYDDYQRGDRFREAVLRIGLCYERVNDCEKARKIYRFAADEFRKTPEGKKAGERDEALGKSCK